jgi:hypothetical protein
MTKKALLMSKKRKYNDDYPRPLSMVKIREEQLKNFKSDSQLFQEKDLLVYLGEIPNMMGHGIFLGYHSGRAYCGYHPEEFVELSEEEI